MPQAFGSRCQAGWPLPASPRDRRRSTRLGSSPRSTFPARPFRPARATRPGARRRPDPDRSGTILRRHGRRNRRRRIARYATPCRHRSGRRAPHSASSKKCLPDASIAMRCPSASQIAFAPFLWVALRVSMTASLKGRPTQKPRRIDAPPVAVAFAPGQTPITLPISTSAPSLAFLPSTAETKVRAFASSTLLPTQSSSKVWPMPLRDDGRSTCS